MTDDDDKNKKDVEEGIKEEEVDSKKNDNNNGGGDDGDGDGGGIVEEQPVVPKKHQSSSSRNSNNSNSIASIPAFVQDILSSSEEPIGLTAEQYRDALAEYGYNEVAVKEQAWYIQLLSKYLGIVPLFIITTAVLSAAVVSHCLPTGSTSWLRDCPCNNYNDWASFILLLIELNLIVYADFAGSRSSGDAMKKLQEASASTVGVKRAGSWEQIPTRELVPGDLVAVTIGMTIPADGVVCHNGEPLKLDYSSLTGEPLPEKKGKGESVLSGAVVLVGEGEMVVTRTGEASSLGTTQALIAEAKKEKEAGGELSDTLSKVIIFLCCFGIVIATFVGAYTAQPFGNNAAEAIKAAFVLCSTILPVTMPLILTTTLAVGAKELAADNAVVQRFSAIPEMANMDILCSDKTGTLTLGKMTCIKDESVVFHDDVTVDEMMEYALIATRIEHSDAIDAAITKYFGDERAAEILDGYNVTKFIPFDPSTKRVTAVATKLETGEQVVVVKGAPPVLMGFSGVSNQIYQKAASALTERSERGYKTLAVCIEIDENEWKLLGLISILDPPRSDTAHTVQKCQELGVEVKMITGDQRLIAVEVARQLKLQNLMIFEKDVFHGNNKVVDEAGGFGPLCERAGGFAGVSPEHKHRVVTALQDSGHFVGMTGDGVNDAPALSIANVGVAVAGATDAARGASDIVLQEEGLSTIVKAIYGSRKIFKRIETYLVYRMCSSFIFGLAFTLIYVASNYNFPTWTLILMSILNDFAVSSSSKDNVIIQRRPVSLKIYKVGTVALAMAITSSLEVWGLVHSLVNYDGQHHFWGMRPTEQGATEFSGCEIAAFTFLSLIITIQFNLFVARSPKPFFIVSTAKDDAGHYTAVPPPGIWVFAAIGGSLSAATFIAVYWDENILMGSGYGMKGMGWRNAGLTWSWALLWFVVIDLIKYLVITIWDTFEREGGNALHMNLLAMKWGQEYDSQERDGHIQSLRESLRRYATEDGGDDVSQALVSSASRGAAGHVRTSTASLGFALALATLAQEEAEDEDRYVTVQDILLASETLQNDQHLLRVVSQLVYTTAKLQDRLDKLEGKTPQKRDLTLSKSLLRSKKEL